MPGALGQSGNDGQSGEPVSLGRGALGALCGSGSCGQSHSLHCVCILLADPTHTHTRTHTRTHIRKLSALKLISSQGPAGRDGTPGPPGADGPPVSTWITHSPHMCMDLPLPPHVHGPPTPPTCAWITPTPHMCMDRPLPPHVHSDQLHYASPMCHSVHAAQT